MPKGPYFIECDQMNRVDARPLVIVIAGNRSYIFVTQPVPVQIAWVRQAKNTKAAVLPFLDLIDLKAALTVQHASRYK